MVTWKAFVATDNSSFGNIQQEAVFRIISQTQHPGRKIGHEDSPMTCGGTRGFRRKTGFRKAPSRHFFFRIIHLLVSFGFQVPVIRSLPILVYGNQAIGYGGNHPNELGIVAGTFNCRIQERFFFCYFIKLQQFNPSVGIGWPEEKPTCKRISKISLSGINPCL